MKKKKDKKYPKSFAKRLTWRIMLTLLVVMGLTSAIIYSFGRLLLYTESEYLIEQIVRKKARGVEHVLSNITVTSLNTVPEIEERLGNPDKLFNLMERLVHLNPLIHSCSISFTENYYPKKGRLFCPYAVQVDSVTIKRFNLNKPEDDYLKDQWFVEGMKAKEGYWSEPYISSTNTPIASYLAPIHDKDGKTVAVFGIDLSLDDLEKEVISNRQYQKRIAEAKQGKDASKEHIIKKKESYDTNFYIIIVDSTGQYLMHPDRDRVGRENMFTYAKQEKDTLATELAKKLTAREEFETDGTHLENPITLEDTDVNAFYLPIKNTNWELCFIMPHLIVIILGVAIGGIMVFFISFGLLVVFFAGRHSIKKAVKPLNQLAASANEVAKGNFETQLPVVKKKDEICMLRDSFEQMQYSLRQYVDELKSTTAQKAAFENELKVAHDIQMSMLPKIFPPYPERKDIDIYGQLTPAKAVGGDLFDFYIHDEKLYFCIGDVSGKGVPASLFMAVTRSLFRNVSTHEPKPHRIIEAMNNSMSEGNEQDMFVTLFVGVLDLATGTLQYCNAGHDAPLVIGQEVSILPCASNLPIGVLANFSYKQQVTSLEPGTTMFLFTDGLNEAENIHHAQFGDERIMQHAQQQVAEHNQQPEPLITAMTKAVHDFVGYAEQSDDLTMLAIAYKP